MQCVCVCVSSSCGGEVLDGLVVMKVVRVVKMVRLMAVGAVADHWMLDAFTLQLFLFVNSFQLCHQLSDEALRRSTANVT